jgi:hypothetical protein
MKITSKNLSNLIQTAFTNSDMGGNTIKSMVNNVETGFSPQLSIEKDDYPSLTIIQALEKFERGGEVNDAISDIDYAIKQLTIARNNLYAYTLQEDNKPNNVI